MNNVHDMGGMQGYGAVETDSDPVGASPFHDDWEKKAFALTLAMGTAKRWNIDEMRAWRESLPPLTYLSSSYFQIWLAGLEKGLIATELATADEVHSGQSMVPAAPGVKAIAPDQLLSALAKGWPSARDEAYTPKFALQQEVRTRLTHPKTHTRLPFYCRDKVGIVTAHHGLHAFPDQRVLGIEQAQWLYTVTFDAHTLWGPDTTADSVSLNCWEPYLCEL